MANPTDLGTQVILWRYATPLVGQTLAEGFSGLLPDGVYSGLQGSCVSSGPITFTAGIVFIKDSAFATSRAMVRIEFKAPTFTITAPLSGAGTPWIVLRYDWAETAINFAYTAAVNAAGILPTDVILGRVTYESGSAVSGFDNGARTKTPASWLATDNGAFAITPSRTVPYQLDITGFTYLSTSVSTGASAKTVAPSGSVAPTGSPPGSDTTYDIRYDFQTGAFSSAASGAGNPLGSYQLLLARATLRTGLSVFYADDIIAHDLRRDFSHITNPTAHGLTRSAASLVGSSFTDTGWRDNYFYKSQQGVGNASPSFFRVSNTVTGMPYSGSFWEVQVFAEGTSGSGKLVCIAYDTTPTASRTAQPGPWVLTCNNSTWDAAGWQALQTGAVPIWSQYQTYTVGQIISRSGVLYASNGTNTNVDPATDLTNTSWSLAGGGGNPTFTVGSSNITSYKFVYVVSGGADNGKIQHADYSDENKTQAIGVVTRMGAAGYTITAGTTSVGVQPSNLLKGFSSGMTPGPIFLAAAGGVTQDPTSIPIGNYRLQLGYAVNATDIMISIQSPVKVIANNVAKTGLGRATVWSGPLVNLPANQLRLNGAAISRTYYGDLFTLYGTTYGAGDGVSTFNLPDWSALDYKDNTGSVVGYQVAQVFPDSVIVSSNTSLASNNSYIPNADFENALTGWNTYADAAAATPVDGTGGSATFIAISRNLTVPLFGTADMLITRSGGGSSAQGQGVSYDITLDPGLLGQVMKTGFFYKTGSGYVDGDMAVFVYDISNSAIVPGSVSAIPASTQASQFVATFIPTTSTRYRLILHVASTNTVVWTANVDRFDFSQQTTPNAAAVGEWTAYTPAVTGFASVSVGARWRRVGSNIEIVGNTTTGVAPAGATYKISLPTGYTVDLSRMPAGVYGSQSNAGHAGIYLSPNFVYVAHAFPTSATEFAFIKEGASGSLTGTDLGASHEVSFKLSVPIAQWTTNINLATDFTEYASSSTQTDTDDASSANSVSDPSGSLANFTFTASHLRWVKFSRPIQQRDLLVFEFYDPTSGIWRPHYGMSFLVGGVVENNYTNNSGVGIYSNTVLATTELQINFLRYRQATLAWSGVVGLRWRVRKVSNGNMAEVPPVVRAEARGNGVIAAGSVLTYTTEVEDTHSAFASGVFTAPIAGVYLVEAELLPTNSGSPVNFKLQKNLADFTPTVYLVDATTTTIAGAHASGLKTVRLLAGESIRIVVNGTGSCVASAFSTFAITRIGT